LDSSSAAVFIQRAINGTQLVVRARAEEGGGHSLAITNFSGIFFIFLLFLFLFIFEMI
jgi:hypothetical protein